jgi:hypothetical protein
MRARIWLYPQQLQDGRAAAAYLFSWDGLRFSVRRFPAGIKAGRERLA